MILLDGKKCSEELFQEYALKVKKYGKEVGLAIIWVGDDTASEIYIKNKMKKSELVGIKTYLYHLPVNTKEKEVIELIKKLNNDNNIKGILLQSPVPKHIDIIKCFNTIDSKKDVDGFTNISIGNLVQGNPYHISCTPKGIIKLLDYYKIDLDGKNVCIINRSLIVGKPLMQLFLERNATVTVCHSHTKDLNYYTKNADIVVSAVGKPNFLTGNMIKEGAIIIDVGISRVNGKVVGDVERESIDSKAAYLTPVPGGIGPMTVAMIFDNITNTLDKEC